MNDKNAAAMEKGLEPIYAFYDRYDHAAKYESTPIPSLTPFMRSQKQGATFLPISCLLKWPIEG